jgi:hypothetical protein
MENLSLLDSLCLFYRGFGMGSLLAALIVFLFISLMFWWKHENNAHH